jgi:nicotinamide-nucleotide amidase
MMPAAEIIAIGTELLLGEIQDTNTRFLARLLRDYGVDIYRTTIVGDNSDRIAQAVRESLQRCQIIITSGGLGPTVDDPTRQAIAQAVDVPLEFDPQLWDQIQDRFTRYGRAPTENNRRQAFIPHGALPIENPVGTAPAFIFETGNRSIISLPGVPHELEFLTQNSVLPYLKEHFDLKETIRASVLYVAGVGESQVDEWIADLELLSNPTVGLLAHTGQIDIRVAAKAGSREDADRMIASITSEIEKRVGENIYGKDGDTLEEVIARKLSSRDLQLRLFESGLSGTLLQHLTGSVLLLDASPSSDPTDLDSLRSLLRECNPAAQDAVYGVIFIPHSTKQTLHLCLLTPDGEFETTRTYGGPPDNAPQWAIKTALDFFRRNIDKKTTEGEKHD